ncbi:MAG TPA: type 2 isopentenyl-diphosphate Delta-isomerase [bacterium]|nr:type 2 isopentenyl-diphosphate Delta-isomerase [bacterium]
MSTSARKRDHLRVALEQDVEFRLKSAGFEAWDFVHCALPEMDLRDVDASTPFLGKTLAFPLLVEGMTGGCRDAEAVNEAMAAACRDQRTAMGLGSLRQLVEDKKQRKSYRVVRDTAPEIALLGNIGGVQLALWDSFGPLQEICHDLRLDGMAVHLNPLQECLQPEGEPRFRGVLLAVERLIRSLDIPVIVKEVGCGLSVNVVRLLHSAGVEWFDIGGAGGTSWAALEAHRSQDRSVADCFREWGIPTSRCLEALQAMDRIQIIASGGIRDGIALAKSLALGARMGGAALPFLRAWHKKGYEGIRQLMDVWHQTLRRVLFLTGSRKIEDLRRKEILYRRS